MHDNKKVVNHKMLTNNLIDHPILSVRIFLFIWKYIAWVNITRTTGGIARQEEGRHVGKMTLAGEVLYDTHTHSHASMKHSA